MEVGKEEGGRREERGCFSPFLNSDLLHVVWRGSIVFKVCFFLDKCEAIKVLLDS